MRQTWMRALPTVAALALPALAPGQEGAARLYCDADNPEHQCPGEKCRCAEVDFSVVFDTGSGPAGSLLEIPDFEAGTIIETAVVFDIRELKFQGFSFAVRHDPEVLEIVSLYPQPSLDLVDLDCRGGHHHGPVAVEGGYVFADIMSLTQPCSPPPGRHEVCRATYRLLGDPGPQGARLELTSELQRPNGQSMPIHVTIDGRSKLPSRLTDGLLQIAGPFRRGDANHDGVVDISDAVFTLLHLFGGGAPPVCADAADANDDGQIDVSDPITALSHLFGGAGLPDPAGACGPDAVLDGQRCLERCAAR